MKNCKVNDLVDAVYVLSVQSFEDRIQHVRQHLGEHGIDFEFIFDYDPTEITDDVLEQIFIPSDLTLPHQSLVLKHIHAWRLGVENNHGLILVLEDDVVLMKGFCEGLQETVRAASAVDPGCFIFLGGSDTKVPKWFFESDDILKPLPNPTAEGFLIDQLAMQKRLQWLEGNKVDLPADHLMQKMDMATGVIQYWNHTPLVKQGSVFGMFQTSLDGSRGKHGPLYNFLRYKWNRFQRQNIRRFLEAIKK